MEIKIASSEKDFTEIREIWEERFTTDREYLNTIFKYIFPLCRSYIYVQNGKAVSVITLMPIRYCDESSSKAHITTLDGFYMFGVATLKEFEGNRYAANLILYASDSLTTEGYSFIFERPANQSLNKYYFNLGFTVSSPKIPHLFSCTKEECSPENIQRNHTLKTLQEHVIKEIQVEHERRFEWKNEKILRGLILLGELEAHMESYTPTPDSSEIYISTKPLSNTNPELFKNTFFCFPME